MDYFLIISAVISYIEPRFSSEFTYDGLAGATGFSLPHLRALFKRITGKSLARYILERRVSHAAFELIHTKDRLLDIAMRNGFDNPDTFTRSFKRVTGVTPRTFRLERRPVGRIKLCMGVYGVSEGSMEMENNMNVTDGTVLYGVPRVGYGVYGCTPYPICIKAAANYLGEDIDYDKALTVSGAAFRLVWDTACWNGGNVDIMFTYEDPILPFKLGIEGIGREFSVLGRQNAKKEDFIAFIKREIDRGRPVIALGIIGPPEACLVTGYRDGGNTLLGWNFFQDNPEFRGGDITFDESGYFITDRWWDNPETMAVISMGEKTHEEASIKSLVAHAISALTGRMAGSYAKGIMAYDAWKKALLDESQFPPKAVMQVRIERIMCHGDGMDCLADGREGARSFFAKLSQQNPDEPLYADISAAFGETQRAAMEMFRTLGGFDRGESQINALFERTVREKLCELIDKCRQSDEHGLKLMSELHRKL